MLAYHLEVSDVDADAFAEALQTLRDSGVSVTVVDIENV